MGVLTGKEYFPYVSCVFWKTILGIVRNVQKMPTTLKLNEELNEHGLKSVRGCHNIVSDSFPVLEATYAKNFSIFEISGQS